MHIFLCFYSFFICQQNMYVFLCLYLFFISQQYTHIFLFSLQKGYIPFTAAFIVTEWKNNTPTGNMRQGSVRKFLIHSH
jgi:hypothetical protein